MKSSSSGLLFVLSFTKWPLRTIRIYIWPSFPLLLLLLFFYPLESRNSLFSHFIERTDRKGFQSILTQKCRIPTKSHSSFITGVCVPNEQIFNANPIIQDPFKKFVPLLSAHRAELSSSSYSGKCAIFDCQIAKRHFANKYDKCIYYEQLILCETDTVVHQ